jgi:hypothetical protein
MTHYFNLALSLALIVCGLILMEPTICSHPMRMLPDCVDAPRNVECK